MRKWLPLMIAVALLGAALFATAPSAQAAWARCDNFGCVNKKLNALHDQQQQQKKKLQELAYDVFQCEQVVGVTSYNGYWYGYYGDYTTALDYTEPGDLRDDWMVVYTCPVSKQERAEPPTGAQFKR
jgi:hypothetical protein